MYKPFMIPILLIVAQILFINFYYWCRTLKFSWAYSDFVLIYVPLILFYGLHCVCCMAKMEKICIYALLYVPLASLVALIVAFNLFGT
jgi:hypothetical protein